MLEVDPMMRRATCLMLAQSFCVSHLDLSTMRTTGQQLPLPGKGHGQYSVFMHHELLFSLARRRRQRTVKRFGA